MTVKFSIERFFSDTCGAIILPFAAYIKHCYIGLSFLHLISHLYTWLNCTPRPPAPPPSSSYVLWARQLWKQCGIRARGRGTWHAVVSSSNTQVFLQGTEETKMYVTSQDFTFYGSSRYLMTFNDRLGGILKVRPVHLLKWGDIINCSIFCISFYHLLHTTCKLPRVKFWNKQTKKETTEKCSL